MSSPAADDRFEALLEYLQRTRGFDFTAYKRPSLLRRMRKRMEVVNLHDVGEYLDYLEVHPEEFTLLFNTILINVTSFFRDPADWDYVARTIVPRLLSVKGDREAIRVWSAGCASGQEAYTLAIVLTEALGAEPFRQRVKIYATDIDEEALAQARQASYSPRDLEAVPVEVREKYFESGNGRFVFRPELRRSVIFGRHDLIQDAPISRLDLLVCRNTLMYFNSEIQERILARFHFALSPGGFLFLGKAEMLLTHAGLFRPLELKHRIFVRAPGFHARDRQFGLSPWSNSERGNHVNRQTRLRDMTFDNMPSAVLIVDAEGTLLLGNARARTLFGIGAHDLGRPFRDLELSYRPVELRSLIERAIAERRMINLSDVEQPSAGEVCDLDIQLAPLYDGAGPVLGVSITFSEVTHNRKLRLELDRSKQELETACEELQSTNEELQTTNEELQSTVEELETTNEELQSSNEEMETMNAELQSTNQEMQHSNTELRTLWDELNRTNIHLQSILSNLRAAVVVVDAKAIVQIWNHRAEDLWGLRSEEARGQPFFNLDIGLPVQQLAEPLRLALDGEVHPEGLILDAVSRRGKALRCRVTCRPLDGGNDSPRGAILLMEEVES